MTKQKHDLIKQYFDLLNKKGKDDDWYGEMFNSLYELDESVLALLVSGIKKQ